MAKLVVASVVLFVAVVICVEGIRIPPPTLSPSGAEHSERVYPGIQRNDPRCARNGVYPDPEDCHAYYVCVDGTSQKRNCPGTSKFDAARQCTYADDADCGVARADDGLSCPEDYGIFPYEEDCHKYVVCVEGIPELRLCPDKLWYQSNVGCIEADKCPKNMKQPLVTRALHALNLSAANRLFLSTWEPDFQEAPLSRGRIIRTEDDDYRSRRFDFGLGSSSNSN